ncbi:hypothetical protein CRI77_24085 [Mycolicibacterium duvalii]|uniref:hypothetical protein n=1 Tax=Mycolicibacterium duvalii TaxID=39688 RepID=UPI000BEEABF2|nr:hypothetical protein [Mycolicibacterium duvalii]MCV7366927.1 hypothetical protein [Mycolicibacterium duvalii]PEG35994.1 hypothetical protein CRI77_24085 [Mycolicibacterium duvalii]
MRNRVLVRGLDLRYLLTTYIHERGLVTVDELVDWLDCQGFEVGDRASKVVSDALRWECARDRVIRVGRGRYRQGYVPRATAYRIDLRVWELQQAARHGAA